MIASGQKHLGFGPLWLALGCILSTGAMAATGNPERGAYLTAAAGCISCHTDRENDGQIFAGGHKLETPYGDFYTPNITPDADTGIGNWSDAEFMTAMREGVSPDNEHYYPSFPYPSYAGVTDQDVLDIRAWLKTVPPVSRTNTDHDLAWYVPGRWAMGIWQWLFSPWEYGPPTDDIAAEDWERGAYLVRHLGHCGECHTPRTLWGTLELASELAGSAKDSAGGGAPNLTPDKLHGLGDWSRGDLEFFLELGMKPNGDFAGGSMTPVVDDNTSQLTPEDRAAMTNFIRSLPAR